MLTLVECCAGVGAFSIGFESTEKVKTIFANDFNPNCKKTFDMNFSIKLDTNDLTKLKPTDIPKMDILTGGFSCQPYSIAGKRKGFDDDRSGVLWSILNIMEHHKPMCVVLENVKNLYTHDNNQTFLTIKQKIESFGYTVMHEIINTSDITDIPQNRERIFLVCFLHKRHADKFAFPEGVKELQPICNFLETDIADKYYYNDRFGVWKYIENNINEHVSTNTVYQLRRKYIRKNKSNVVPCFTRNMGTGGHNVPLILDDIGIRKLTPRECFNLQGYPGSYILPNISDSHLYQQVGNSITVDVTKKIANNIIKCLC